MATFPKLRTGAICQYPLEIQTRYRTEVYQFLDNTEQCFTDCTDGRSAWVINMSELSAQEVSTLQLFWESQLGRFGTFTFIDPYANPSYLNWLDVWSSATTYHVNDGTSYLGIGYISLQSSNHNHEPDTSPTYWSVLPNVFCKCSFLEDKFPLSQGDETMYDLRLTVYVRP